VVRIPLGDAAASVLVATLVIGFLSYARVNHAI
jgi:hypothetical protein